jgi:transcriptional regulator with XRE-family HTH domain
MGKVRKSTRAILARDPRLYRLVFSILARLEAMGVMRAEAQRGEPDLELLRRLAREAARAGIGRQSAAYILGSQKPDTRELLASLQRLEQATEESPVPQTEWPAVERVLGAETLAGLLGVSPISVQRYRRGERQAPDRVVARLHFVALLVADLSGTYTEEGVRLWLGRPRTLLEGRTPAQLLSGEWAPEDTGPARVKELARSLAGSPAT